MAVEQKPLMPKATAVWLVDNTALSFEQIADFCACIRWKSKASPMKTWPRASRARSRCHRPAHARADRGRGKGPPQAPQDGARQAQDAQCTVEAGAALYAGQQAPGQADAVYWLIRNHAEFSDSDIIKLIGTTKATIAKIRERSHWNAATSRRRSGYPGPLLAVELDLA